MKMHRLAGATIAVTATLLVAPGAASAATTCDFTAGILQVDMAQTGDNAQLRVLASAIEVTSVSGGPPLVCTGGAPTVVNTGVISVFNHPAVQNNAVDISTPDSFAPGPNPQDNTDNQAGDLDRKSVV